MNEDVSGDQDYTSHDEFVLKNVFTGTGNTYEEALDDAAGHALNHGHPRRTQFEITKAWGRIENPRVTDYRVIITKSGPPD
jgi:hypothetical protein